MLFNARLCSAVQQAVGIPQLLLNNRPISSHLQNQNPPHKSIYNHLFSQLKSPPNLFEARKLHALLIQGGYFNPNCDDTVLGSQLINIYVKFGRLHEEALITFNKLPNKNSIAWNAILRGLVDMGQFSEAIEFFNHFMLRQCVIPDTYTYPLVLKACSGLSDLDQGRRVLQLIQFNETHHNVKRNIYVECVVVDMFAKCGGLDEARQLFEEMPRKDLASWTAIISGTVRNGEWIEALSLFGRMMFEGLRPDSIVIAAIIPACYRLEARLIGMALQGYGLRSGFKNDLYVSNALIDMYCKSGDTYEAHRIFCEMACKDEVSWSTMISGYSHCCYYRESIELYFKMKSSGIRTNAVMMASVLPGLGKLKLLKQGKEIHNYILKQGFESDIVLGSALIDMYANCGVKREAEHIFEIMSERDITI